MTNLKLVLGLILIVACSSRLGDLNKTIQSSNTTSSENKTRIPQNKSSVTPSPSDKKAVKPKILVLPTNKTSQNKLPLNTQSNKNLLRDLIYDWINIKNQGPKEDPCIDLLQSPFFSAAQINAEQSSSILSLGNFIQGKSLYSQSLAELPISPSYRFPIRILTNQNIEPFWTKSSSPADVHLAIQNALKNYRGYIVPETYVKIQRYQQSQYSNFKANNIKFLNRNSNFIPKNKSSKKVELIIVQKTIQFSVDKVNSDQDVMNDPIGVFFRQSFNIQIAKRLRKFNYWGKYNIPCYIDSITYGKLLVAKVDENSKTLKIYDQFLEQTQISEDLVTEFLDQDNIEVQSIGSYDRNIGEVKQGKWTNFFNGDYFTESGIQTLKPIAYKIKDFRGQIAKQFCFIESGN